MNSIRSAIYTVVDTFVCCYCHFQLMEVGQRGQSGGHVLRPVGVGTNRDLTPVRIHDLHMEVPVVLAVQLTRELVQQMHA